MYSGSSTCSLLPLSLNIIKFFLFFGVYFRLCFFAFHYSPDLFCSNNINIVVFNTGEILIKSKHNLF